ncbi:MAG: hypothetical protein RL291_900 [Pseudomonadota bacterium]|jgi:hypothetical protein
MRQRKPRKIGGTRLEHFFTRFYAAEPGLSKAHADNLVRRSLLTFTSVRVRPGARLMLGMPGGGMHVGEVPPAPTRPRAPATPPSKPANDEPAQTPAAAFDPYAIGLVPTMQREGRAGLMTKLAGINDRSQLRQMARAQQIALDPSAKGDDIAIDGLKAAIADAVEKRIKDRQSARE